MFSIYILELEGNRYYIGKTQDTTTRIKKHFKGYGSEYTKKFKPVKIEKIIYSCDDELKYTLEYMKKYGIENVRGGPFVKLELPREYIITIKQILSSQEDRCFNCGEAGHFVRECKMIKKDENISLFKKCSKLYNNFTRYINFYLAS